MPFYPPLQLNPLQNSFTNFAQGLNAAEQYQGKELQNALIQRKLEQEQGLQNAMQNYTQGGDITPIMRANLPSGLKLREQQMEEQKLKMLQTKQEWDQTKPALQYMFSMGGMIRKDPSVYPKIREQAIKNLPPHIGAMFPPVWSEDMWKGFEEQYTKMLKLEDPFGLAKLGLRAQEVGAKTDYYQGKLAQGAQKLDIDRQKAEQDKFTGNVGTAFKILRRRLGRDPSDDELQEFNDRFQSDIAKTKNPAVLAIESLTKEDDYKFETDPAKKRQMLQQRTKDYEELMRPYKRGGGKSQTPRGLQDLTTDEIRALIEQKSGGQ